MIANQRGPAPADTDKISSCKLTYYCCVPQYAVRAGGCYRFHCCASNRRHKLVLAAVSNMNKVNITLFLAALLVVGACAEPRKLLASNQGAQVADASEHQRILAELEEVHQLRERMLQEGKILHAPSSNNICTGSSMVFRHPCCAVLQFACAQMVQRRRCSDIPVVRFFNLRVLRWYRDKGHHATIPTAPSGCSSLIYMQHCHPNLSVARPAYCSNHH